MADLFLSHARADQRSAAAIAAAAQGEGRTIWWDRSLIGGSDYGPTIQRELAAAGCVVVAWSAAARNSLWVQGEAYEALDRGRLVQLSLDEGKPPAPFDQLQWSDFSGWGEAREQRPWPELKAQLDSQLGARAAPEGRRPDPGGVPIVGGSEPALQGFRLAAALGWSALGTMVVLALAVLMVVRRLISADAFAVVSVALLAVAALLLGACAWIVLRTLRASRR